MKHASVKFCTWYLTSYKRDKLQAFKNVLACLYRAVVSFLMVGVSKNVDHRGWPMTKKSKFHRLNALK